MVGTDRNLRLARYERYRFAVYELLGMTMGLS